MGARSVKALVLAGALAASGCSVSEFEAARAEATPNLCEVDADCGSQGRCLSGTCRGTAGMFTSVLLEITPPTDAPPVQDGTPIPIAGVRFFKLLHGLSPGGGFQNIALDHVAHVTGNITPVGSGESIAARVTFTPTERLLGLATPPLYKADANAGAGYDVWMPPGTYDIYVQPADAPTISGECPVVPQLVRKHVIPAGDVTLEIPQPAPAKLELTILWPREVTTRLVGWTLDMVEPITGRVISNRVPIEPTMSFALDGRYKYVQSVCYSPVAGRDSGEPGSELVRLSPPEGVVAPTLLMQRKVLELFSVGHGVVDQIETLPPIVNFSGRVTAAENPDIGLGGTKVTLSAEPNTLEGLEGGTLAAFKRELVTDADGSFSVDVLAGTYRVHAVPSGGSGRAAKLTTLEIAAYPPAQSGKLIQLDTSALLSGRVLTPGGQEPVAGASVHAIAAATSIQITGFDAAFGDKPFVPQASRSCEQNALCNLVDQDGLFSIEADPGTFDVSVRPPETTGFSWLVRPNVPLADEQNLGEMAMPLPVPYTGVVTAPDGTPVARALIRAYVYMAEGEPGYVTDPAVAKSVLQIGETRAGDDASFVLLLPSGLN